MEHDEQKATVDYFRLQYAKWRLHIFAIPNGAVLCDLENSKRGHRMHYLRAEGFLDGVADLLIAVPCGTKSGLFLEMKNTGRTLSAVTADQLEFLQRMRMAGYSANWAAGFEQARRIIDAYMALGPRIDAIPPDSAALLTRGGIVDCTTTTARATP